MLSDEGQGDEMEYIEIGKNPIPTDLMLPYEVSMFTELHESDAQGGALIITSRGLGKLSSHFNTSLSISSSLLQVQNHSRTVVVSDLYLRIKISLLWFCLSTAPISICLPLNN